MLRMLIVAGLCCVFVSPSYAALIAYEGFQDYNTDATGSPTSDSLLTGNNGGFGWTDAWTSVAGPAVVAPGIPLSFGTIQGGSRALQLDGTNNNSVAFRSFPSQTGDLYVSFLYRSASAGAIGNGDFVQFTLSTAAPGTNNDIPNISFSNQLVTARLGSNLTATNTTPITDGTSFLVVARLWKTTPGESNLYNHLTMWLNPVDESSFSQTVDAFTGFGPSVSVVNFRTNGIDAGDLSQFDEIRIGTTFASVIPEPSLFLGCGMAALGMWRLRRKSK